MENLKIECFIVFFDNKIKNIITTPTQNITMFDSRNKLSTLVANDVREHFGNLVYNTVIPRNVKVSEAPSHGMPALIYDFRCPGSQAYIHLAGEILRQEKEPDS